MITLTRKPYRALVVEDDQGVRQLVAQALADEGFTCDMATDGVEAGRLTQRRRYDLVVTDLKMPNRNGHSFCCEVLELPVRPHLVVLTAVSEPRLVRDLLARGVADVCFKPVNCALLAAKLRMQVGQRTRLDAQAVAPGSPGHPIDAPEALPAGPASREACPSPGTCPRTGLADTDRSSGTHGGDCQDDGDDTAFGCDTVLTTRPGPFDPVPLPGTGPEFPGSPLALQAAWTGTRPLWRGLAPEPAGRRRLPRPEATVRLLSCLKKKPDSLHPDDVVHAITSEPRASAGVLRLCRILGIGSAGRSSYVRDAIRLLGPHRATHLALASVVLAWQSELLESAIPELRDWYSRRSVAIAATASALADRCGRIFTGQALLCGLLQDLGLLVRFLESPADFLQIMEQARAAGLSTPAETDLDADGRPHAAASADILLDWDFPESIVRPVRHHHQAADPGGAEDIRGSDDPQAVLVRILQTAEGVVVRQAGSQPLDAADFDLDLSCPRAMWSLEFEHCLNEARRRTSQLLALTAPPQQPHAALRTFIDQLA